MIDNAKNNIYRGGGLRFCYVTVGRGSSILLPSVTEEGEGLENGKFGVT